MVPRWSRLAFAAILAFGASPGPAEASAAEAPRPPTCCGARDRMAGPSLVCSVTADLFDRHGPRSRPATPLCAIAPAIVVARVAPQVEARAPWTVAAEPVLGRAGWRLAPKTSPPRR